MEFQSRDLSVHVSHMRMLKSALALLLSITSLAEAQVFADFTVLAGTETEEEFRVELDWEKQPITVTNFMLLAGAKDEVWHAPPNNAALSRGLNFRPLFAGRPDLTVGPAAEGGFEVRRTSPTLPFQPVPLLGSVQNGLFDSAIEPTFTVEKEFVPELQNAERFVLRLKYRRRWFDNNTGTSQSTAFYTQTRQFSELKGSVFDENLLIRGSRLFGGSRTTFAGNNVGYLIPDEMFANQATVGDPWGNPFGDPFVIAMDNLGPNTASSRFFITGTTEGRDDRWTGNFTRFGFVPQNGNRPLVDRLLKAAVSDISTAPNYRIIDIDFRIMGSANNIFFPHQIAKESLPVAPTLAPTDQPFEISQNRLNGTLNFRTLLQPLQQAAIQPSADLLDYRSGLIYGSGNPEAQERFVNFEVAVNRFRPREFYRNHVLTHPSWPALDFNSGNGPSGLTLRLFEKQELRRIVDDTPQPAPRNFLMNFSTGMLTFGQEQFPFSWTYDGTTNPYLGIVSLSGLPNSLPIVSLRLFFDGRDGKLFNRSNIRRFEALEPEQEIFFSPDPRVPPQVIFITPNFSGVWEDITP